MQILFLLIINFIHASNQFESIKQIFSKNKGITERQQESKTCKILALQGGGAHGCVEIGMLKKFMDTRPRIYNLITGVSAGSLNAGFLS